MKIKNIRRDIDIPGHAGGGLGLEFSELGVEFQVYPEDGSFPSHVWFNLREKDGQEKLKLLISELQQQLVMTWLEEIMGSESETNHV